MSTEAIAERLVAPDVAGVCPLHVILFGSHATGPARPSSDVDLLVVMPDGTDSRRMVVEASLQLPLGRGVDLLVDTPGVLERHRNNSGLVYRQVRTDRDVYVAPGP